MATMVRGEGRPLHPGRTGSERRILDAIGCGEHSPPARAKTLERMVEAGLIVELAPRILEGRMAVRIRQYDMPTRVHMDWCEAVSHGLTDADLARSTGPGRAGEG